MTTATTPAAGRLVIYSKGGQVTIGDRRPGTVPVDTKVAWSLFAPLAPCNASSSSTGAADLYGAMVCARISSQGTWRFHYDDRLRDLSLPGPPVLGTTAKVWSLSNYRAA